MKKEIYDMQEMSDSKEIYGTRPNPFIAAFIYCLAGLLLAAILYAVIGTIDITASAAGIVRPNDEISTVSSLISGRVAEVKMTDGQQVSKGDLLFRLDMGESEVTLEGLKENKKDLATRIIYYEEFAEGIEEGKNPFSSEKDGAEYPYYIEFENYLLSLENSQRSAAYDQKTREESIRKLEEQIGLLETEIAGLSAYKKSIEEGKNHCGDFPDYEVQYNMYVLTMDALEEGGAAESTKEQTYYEAISQADTSLGTLEAELAEATSQLTLNELALDAGNSGESGNVQDAASVEMLSGVLHNIKTLQDQLDEIDVQMKQLESQCKQAEVTAGIDGIVNLVNPLVAGDVVAAGTALATIMPSDEGQFKVQLYVSNTDIGNVNVGDEVKYNLAAFPSSQYGIVKGKVTSISKDVINNESGYSGYYLVEASIYEKDLIDKDGNQGQITPGMELAAKIVTQQKRILRYLLEKINLF